MSVLKTLLKLAGAWPWSTIAKLGGVVVLVGFVYFAGIKSENKRWLAKDNARILRDNAAKLKASAAARKIALEQSTRQSVALQRFRKAAQEANVRAGAAQAAATQTRRKNYEYAQTLKQFQTQTFEAGNFCGIAPLDNRVRDHFAGRFDDLRRRRSAARGLPNGSKPDIQNPATLPDGNGDTTPNR